MAAALKRVVPMANRVLVVRTKSPNRTKSGIVVPNRRNMRVSTGTVVAVGPGLKSPSGELIPPAVSVGDSVVLPEWGGTRVSLDDMEYRVLRDTDILAKIDK